MCETTNGAIRGAEKSAAEQNFTMWNIRGRFGHQNEEVERLFITHKHASIPNRLFRKSKVVGPVNQSCTPNNSST